MRLNKAQLISGLRHRIRSGTPIVGTWLQIPNTDTAEIIGDAGYDWAAVDMEHGAFSRQVLHDVFRALELGGTIPMARIAKPDLNLCQQALDAGAVGVIIPRVESAQQLSALISGCNWPPSGRRGVGYSRANLYGKYFLSYREESQASFVVAQIESTEAVRQTAEICQVPGLDAVMIGPYDLSASLGHTGDITNHHVQTAIYQVATTCRDYGVASGIHVVQPEPAHLKTAIDSGHRFIAYGTDAQFLLSSVKNPLSSL